MADQATAEARAPKWTSCREITAYVDEHVAAIEDLTRELLAATASSDGRPLEWSDVTSLGRVREQLSATLDGFNASQVAAQWRRSAREVATRVRQFRD